MPGPMHQFELAHLDAVGFDASKMTAAVRDNVRACTAWGAVPDSGAQGSPLLLPTGAPDCFIAAHSLGEWTAAHDKAAKEFLAAALRWWWSGDPSLESEPAAYATWPDGSTMLNQWNQPMKTKKPSREYLHFTLMPYLRGYCITGEPLFLNMAVDLVTEFRAFYMLPGRVESIDNDRQLRVLIDFCRDWYQFTNLMGAADQKVLPLLKRAFDRCLVEARGDEPAPKEGWPAPLPHLFKNDMQALKADHAFCDVGVWQAEPNASAVDLLETVLPLTEAGKKVRELANAVGAYAGALADLFVPGAFRVADYGTNGKINLTPDNAMVRWGMPAATKASPEQAARAYTVWKKSDWSRTWDKNFKGRHNLCLNLFMISRYGVNA